MKPYYQFKLNEAGCDESGRGSLSGPVFAAAVILPRNFKHPLVKDSKKLSEYQRQQAYNFIVKNAVAYSIEQISAAEIDKINILNASILAMHLALDKLEVEPEFILVDGDRFKPYKEIPYKCIIKGDDIYYSIAAASILAKVERDVYMQKISNKYPVYEWASNKGYASGAHRRALEKHGPSEYHRKTFIVNFIEQQKIHKLF